MVKALFVRSDFDIATLYLAAYGKKLADYAIEKGYEVVDLYNDAALPARLLRFETEMDKQPDVVMVFGHGNQTIVTGQDLEVLLKVGVNDDLMSGKKCFLASCLTGVQLGPSMVEKTCPEYYGFLADFTFIYHPDYETKPLEDPWAKAFFDCVLATGYSILENRTPKEVYENTINRYNYWWDWWVKQNDPVTDDILTWLNWNRSNFIAITPTGIYEKEKATLGLSGLVIPIGAAAILFLLLSR